MSSKKVVKAKQTTSKVKHGKKSRKKTYVMGDWVETIERRAHQSRPADYSFKAMKDLTEQKPEEARLHRLGLLKTGPKQLLLSNSMWLNHNRLKSLRNLQEIVVSVLEYPEKLSYLDISCNELTDIHDDIFKYPNIAILYLHGNRLNELFDIYKLRKLQKLRALTLYGNPFCERSDVGNIRKVVSAYLPNLKKLDHNHFSQIERSEPLSIYALRLLRKYEGEPPDWLFRKFPIPKATPELLEKCKQFMDKSNAKPEKKTDASECKRPYEKCDDTCPEKMKL